MGDKIPDFKRPSDYDEVTPEMLAEHLLQCVTRWQMSSTDEERGQWKQELTRLMRVLLPRGR